MELHRAGAQVGEVEPLDGAVVQGDVRGLSLLGRSDREAVVLGSDEDAAGRALEHGIPALSGIDTRSLVLHLRDQGSQRAALVSGECSVEEALAAVRQQPEMAGRALVREVSTPKRYVFSAAGRARIAVVDYGCKRSILRRLEAAGAAVTVFPHDADPDELAAFDGVLLSNGPGDPGPLHEEVAAVKALLGRTPILGICLGHQLLGLAVGARTTKMHQGHRGANHPVKRLADGRVEITSMNHGFAVEKESLPANARETHVSLFDGSNCGIELTDRPAFSVQYHPEASPGPQDSVYLFAKFVGSLESGGRAK